MRLTSSCNPETRKRMNSWQSCCPYLGNIARLTISRQLFPIATALPGELGRESGYEALELAGALDAVVAIVAHALAQLAEADGQLALGLALLVQLLAVPTTVRGKNRQ